MKQIKRQYNCLPIKAYNYSSQETPAKINRSRSSAHNPIKIVVDLVGDDGNVRQKIINQSELEEPQSERKSKLLQSTAVCKLSPERQGKIQHRSLQKLDSMTRTFVFNRFNYENHFQFRKGSSKKWQPSKKKIEGGQKNIEIIFCQSKLPQFVNKTNNQIQEIYKKQQIKNDKNSKNLLQTSIKLNKQKNYSPEKNRTAPKTNLANCLKQYNTLQKLSFFIQNQQKLREKCLCHSTQKDPSKNLLLDVITHRFTFLKQKSRKIRQQLYKSLLYKNTINQFTKINIHEYMKIYAMFIARDATTGDIARFMHLFLFNSEQSYLLENIKHKIQSLKGPVNKQNYVIEEIKSILGQQNIDVLHELTHHQKLLRTFIDLITEY